MFPDPLRKLEHALAQGIELSDELVELASGLQGDALDRFENLWRELDAEQRVSLLAHLGEAAEENLVLDFSPVYALAFSDPAPLVRESALRYAAEEAKPNLLDVYLHAAVADPDPDVRLTALEKLGAFTLLAQTEDWPAVLQDQLERTLVRTLHLPDADLAARRAALLSLAYLTTAQSAREIQKAYLQPDLRDAAVLAMGRNCQDMWITDLVAELGAESPLLRMAAAQACAEMEDQRLVPHLIRQLEDPDGDVKVAAVKALGAIGGRDAKGTLSELLTSRSPALRNAALEAMDALLANADPFAGS